MALRRTLSLRSLLSARCYQPSYSCIIRREEKPHYPSLHQISFSSSILSQHLGRSSSHLSLCTPFGVSIRRPMSTSHIPVSGVNKEDVASQTTVTKVVDAVQQLISRVQSFTGFNWWFCFLLTAFVAPLVTLLLIDIVKCLRIVIHYLIWKMLLRLTRVYLDTMDQGGHVADVAKSQKEYEDLVKEYGGKDVFDCSTSAFSLARLQPWLFSCMRTTEKVASFTTGSALWFIDITRLYTLSIFPFEEVFYYLIGMECFGLLGLVGLKALGKQWPAIQVEARICARSLTIYVALIGTVLSKVAQCYFKTCSIISLSSMHLLYWFACIREQHLNEKCTTESPCVESLE